MKIYVRNDINMRKGKICAQVSHACMAIWLDSMNKTKTDFTLEGNNLELFNEWKNAGYPIEIIKVDLETLLSKQNKNTVIIQDAGRTEFKEPTITCMAEYEGLVFTKDKYRSKEDKPSKQVLIANRDKKLNKYDLAPIAARASWKVIEKMMLTMEDKKVLNLNEALYFWLNHGFAKITLKADTEKYNEIKEVLKDNNIIISEELDIIMALEPKLISDVDVYTSELKLY